MMIRGIVGAEAESTWTASTASRPVSTACTGLSQPGSLSYSSRNELTAATRHASEVALSHPQGRRERHVTTCASATSIDTATSTHMPATAKLAAIARPDQRTSSRARPGRTPPVRLIARSPSSVVLPVPCTEPGGGRAPRPPALPRPFPPPVPAEGVCRAAPAQQLAAVQAQGARGHAHAHRAAHPHPLAGTHLE